MWQPLADANQAVQGFAMDSMIMDRLAMQSPLWADLYALTQAQALFTAGQHMDAATFHGFIRATPYGGSYLVTAGQGIVGDFFANRFQFDKDALAYLQSLGKFTPDFLALLEEARPALTIDAMREGELAFADEPIYRVSGPLWQGLMAECAILNTLNSQALIATEAARLLEASGGAPVVEFGLRRAHDIGGLAASRAAYIGGCAGTSNLEAGRLYNIPVSGTFSHALVMAYEDEVAAFSCFADAYPHATIFLVDTYNTLRGVDRLIALCQKRGIRPWGIRLDSGDLTWLSIESRKKLDAAGFTDTKIVATNDLDPMLIAAIRAEGGKIDLWGVGTSLVTGSNQPSLGAVYKLAEIDGRAVLKISEQALKTTLPGAQNVRRYLDAAGQYAGDVILPAGFAGGKVVSARRDDHARRKTFREGQNYLEPIVAMFKDGRPLQDSEPLTAARDRAANGLKRLDSSHRRLLNPHRYVVGIEQGLLTMQEKLTVALTEGN